MCTPFKCMLSKAIVVFCIQLHIFTAHSAKLFFPLNNSSSLLRRASYILLPWRWENEAIIFLPNTIHHPGALEHYNILFGCVVQVAQNIPRNWLGENGSSWSTKHNRLLLARITRSLFRIVRAAEWSSGRIHTPRNVFIFISPDRNILRRKFLGQQKLFTTPTLYHALLYLRLACNIVLMRARYQRWENLFLFRAR